MLLEEAIFAHLRADSDVTALCGDRIHPTIAPQPAVYPCVVFTRVGAVRSHTHGGPDLLPDATIQFDCMGLSAKKANLLAAAVRKSLDGFSGIMGPPPGLRIGGAFADGDISGHDDNADNERGVFLASIDIEFQYDESA